MRKRTFLRSLATLPFAAVPSFEALASLVQSSAHQGPTQLATDEDFWKKVRGDYRLKPDYINLENGYYCFLPQPTLEHLIEHIREVNYQGSYYMRTVQWKNKRDMAAKLAALAGCTPEELIITRNTTESLDTIISGIDWQKGDEAIMAEQDYGAMLNQFKLVEKRYGVIRKVVSVPLHPESDEAIVELYAKAITGKTRLLMVSHMINITGHILPIRKICDMAHSKGVDVLVDGAHTFGHIQFSIPELGCDYFGSSLHKWLSVPLGAGILYVRKGKASSIWPLIAEEQNDPNDIYRLNHTGTHPVYTDLTIADAIDYHNTLGGARKEARLRYLQSYWTSKVRDLSHILVNTPADAIRHCGIGNVGVKGMKPNELAVRLMKEHKINCAVIDISNVHGCRITPNVYTTTAELDQLVNALKSMA